MRDATLEIYGTHCDGCAARVKTLLERDPRGVRAEVFTKGQARIRYNQHAVSVARVSS